MVVRWPGLAFALAFPPAAVSQGPAPDSAWAATAPLFASHEPLTLTIQAPLSAIFKERGPTSAEYPGSVLWHRPEEAPVALDVKIRTRGRTRLSRRICDFPPLRLNFSAATAASTPFLGQDKLKLVVHCQDRAEYQQYVLQEYLIYRAFNLLTDISFRTRLVRATYIDTDARRDTVTRYGFLLEADDMMAARNGQQPLLLRAVPPKDSDLGYLALVGVFQYMIGNPDWSPFGKAPDEAACCHNTEPIGTVGGPVFAVPYDFDITGLVNTRYADLLFGPSSRNLGISSVRERVYRGVCPVNLMLPDVIARFQQQREAIYRLYRGQADLDPAVLKHSLEYLDQFYATINSPAQTDRELVGRCRG
ncbi:MAG TPA: hypothetical protein VD793_12130 [Gemmatimonadales bacterium]|nr:hypothetical protein [Gemmatimonadales bacterium]